MQGFACPVNCPISKVFQQNHLSKAVIHGESYFQQSNRHIGLCFSKSEKALFGSTTAPSPSGEDWGELNKLIIHHPKFPV
jgi:hypothetical protein